MKSTTKISQSLVLLLLYRSWQGRDSWWTGSDIQRHKLRWSRWSWSHICEVEVVLSKLSCRKWSYTVESEVVLSKMKLSFWKWSWGSENEVEFSKVKLCCQNWSCVAWKWSCAPNLKWHVIGKVEAAGTRLWSQIRSLEVEIFLSTCDRDTPHIMCCDTHLCECPILYILMLYLVILFKNTNWWIPL